MRNLNILEIHRLIMKVPAVQSANNKPLFAKMFIVLEMIVKYDVKKLIGYKK